MSNDDPVLNFVIAGAAKSGTTSLARYLAGHPDISICDPKEPQYFSRLSQNRLNIESLDMTFEQYLSLFEQDSCIKGDASTSYLYEPTTALHLSQHNPHLKIIVILRDPVERAYSNYLMNRRDEIEPCASFRGALELECQRIRDNWPWNFRYVSIGRYREQLNRYYDVFPADQIRVFSFEELKESPETVTREAITFLGCDPAKLPNGPYLRLNASQSSDADNFLNRFIRRIPILRGQLRERSVLRMMLRHLVSKELKLQIKSMFLPPEGATGMSESERAYLEDALSDELVYLSKLFPNGLQKGRVES